MVFLSFSLDIHTLEMVFTVHAHVSWLAERGKMSLGKRGRAEPSGAPPMELRYFPLLAKGLGPALVLEHSGLPWRGNRDLPFSISSHWAALKPLTPFGQLPLLSVPSVGLEIAQTTAILNYVGRKACTEGATDKAFAINQMLIAEAEDLYGAMNKFLPTVYKRLSTAEVITSKGTREDYDSFWATLLPAKLEKLERLWAGPAGEILFPPSLALKAAGAHPGFMTGELYLWSMLFQLTLVDKEACWPSEPVGDMGMSQFKYESLFSWYAVIEARKCTQDVIEGRSSMGELRQYYQHADSGGVCSEGDERGRWG